MEGNLTGNSHRYDDEKIDVHKLERKSRQLPELNRP